MKIRVVVAEITFICVELSIINYQLSIIVCGNPVCAYRIYVAIPVGAYRIRPNVGMYIGGIGRIRYAPTVSHGIINYFFGYIQKVGGNGLAIAPNKNNTLNNFQTGES